MATEPLYWDNHINYFSLPYNRYDDMTYLKEAIYGQKFDFKTLLEAWWSAFYE